MKKEFLLIVIGFFLVLIPSTKAWWNTSYNHYRNITNSSAPFLLPANGTSTSDIDSNGVAEQYYVIPYSGHNTSIYYNNENDAVNLNSTNEICLIETIPTERWSCPNPPEGLKYYWTFDQDSGNATDPISGNNATGGTDVTKGLSAKIYHGWNSTGQNGITSTNNVGISGSASRTIAFWAKVYNPQDDARDPMVGWGDGSATDAYFLVNVRNIADADDEWGVNLYADDPSFGVSADSNWNYHVVTYDGTQIIYYLNGAPIGSPYAVTLATTDTQMIAGHDDVNNQNTEILVDDVRIYNRSLSATEVKQLYDGMIGIYLGAEQSLGTAPVWSNNKTSPSSPTTYAPNKEYQFNVTCEDSDDGIYNAWLTFNGNDYTMNNQSSEYYYTLSDLSADSYTYSFTCNNTNNLQNTTDTWNYIIEKNNTMLNLTFNSTEGNATYTYPVITNATAWNNVTGSTGVTLYRDGSSVSNPEIIQLASGTYNYTAIYSHQNYTAEPKTYFLTINKANSGLVLTSTAGWSLYDGDTTTLSCSAVSPLTLTLSVNGNYVSIPYTIQVETGSYDVSCVISDTYNYTPTSATNTIVVNPLISCTDAGVFAFNKTISTSTDWTTLNFTSLMDNQSYVRKNLGDIKINNVTGVYKNTTNGYYIVVNNTGLSTFVVEFGNYLANNSWTNHALSGDVKNMTPYNQSHPFVIYNVLDELTGEHLYPPNTTLMSIIHCVKGENYIPIEKEETQFLLASREYVDKASLRVKYTADMYYSRQFYPSIKDKLILNFYVVDAFENALDRIDFKMLDTNYYNSKLQVYKTVSNSTIVMTEGYFDISHYFSAYLMEDSDYYLKTINPDGSETEFGRITVVKPAEKTLGKVTINLNPQAVLIANNIFMNAYMNDDRTKLYIDYNDALNGTEQIIITTYFENGTVWKNESFTSSSVNLEYNTTDYNNTGFSVKFTLYHDTLGNSPVVNTMSLFLPDFWNLGMAGYMYNLISLGILFFVGGITTRRSLIGGILLFMISFLILYGIGWLSVGWILLAFIAVISLLSIINYLQGGGE